ncbi:anthranilate synthase component II [Bowmanella dokdonensis]|uniref:Aminodeoxychorismate/anthranilate synthase component II n=1 Tax=Bowmanella dokdonensis TaxID=751969 RepID=A0A939IMI0_9ALTE|nr:aminodeoxychorismate/anthranilate synthase component II [Bowmanella dokdonensis]MBN7823815.1 aminodeoxychorismate/anthranilate synthase component II [Bowmanella dokdonensis]
MLLMIDNYDSFSHNLVRYFRELGQQVEVVRNDQLSVEQIAARRPDYLVLSPGPCTPNESGITLAAIDKYAGVIPILGVCLGYQAIGQVFGASVVRAERVMHGKTSRLGHAHSPLFQGVDNPFLATRYHSLVLASQSIPNEFRVTAWVEDAAEQGTPMAIEHRSLPLCGVQFHPESVMTPAGHQILSNFLQARPGTQSGRLA